MRKKFLLGVAISSALAIGGGTAVAHEIEHDSTITIRYVQADDEFAGKVNSLRDRCEQGRTVRIVRVENDGNTLVAKGTTNENGSYSIGYDVVETAEYRARVTREVLRDTQKHTHVCAPDSSPTITVAALP